MDQSELQQVAQCGRICEPDGQLVMIASLLHGKRKDRFTAAHQVGQTVVTVSDVYRAAAVPNGISLCEDQRAVLLTFCEAAKCKDAQCTKQKQAEAGRRCHPCPAWTGVFLFLLHEPVGWKSPERNPEALLSQPPQNAHPAGKTSQTTSCKLSCPAVPTETGSAFILALHEKQQPDF